MAHILHFIESEGDKEYIVITDCEIGTWDDHKLPGFELNASYELEDLDYCLTFAKKDDGQDPLSAGGGIAS